MDVQSDFAGLDTQTNNACHLYELVLLYAHDYWACRAQPYLCARHIGLCISRAKVHADRTMIAANALKTKDLRL